MKMREKVIGILGGMGPEATRDLYAHIIRLTPADRDQDHLHTVIDSNPKIPDRTAHIVGDGEDPVPAMVESGKRLQRAHADFIIIPCISAHYFLDALQRRLELPVLSVFEAVAQEIHIYSINGPVGLLATDGTIQGGKFAHVLNEYGIPTLVPDSAFQQQVMEGIYTVKADPAGEKRNDCRRLFAGAAAHLVSQGACCIIAGCTEIPLALSAADITVPLKDPLETLAAAAVSRALGKRDHV